MEEQSQVEELQKSLQEQGSKADDVSNEMLGLYYVCITLIPVEMLATTTESQNPIIPHLANKDVPMSSVHRSSSRVRVLILYFKD